MTHAATSYDMTLVVLSYVISVFGAYTALQLAVAIPGAKGNALWGWLGGAALAMGGGAIWSMHFIAMLAFRMPMQVGYDVALTLGSLLVAVAVTGVGLFIVGRGEPGFGRLLAAGTFTGLGVAAMHYTGMAAMVMPARLTYAPVPFALSLVIAIVASMAALWLAFNLRGNAQRFGSAFVMGAAVCGMHYTGMAAANFTFDYKHVVRASSVMESDSLALSIFLVTAALLSITLIVALKRSQRTLEYQL
ncbi:MAG TPA: MHYT domain-containing protein [Thermoanaerobaculia bacterium]|nr:MHYT domain-containing protein [Thermoanaerobaculia bacterium]